MPLLNYEDDARSRLADDIEEYQYNSAAMQPQQLPKGISASAARWRQWRTCKRIVYVEKDLDGRELRASSNANK